MATNSPVTVGMDFFVGEDKTLPFEVLDETTGQFLDVSSMAFTFKLFSKQGSAVVLTLPAVITNGPAGQLEVDFATADTSSLTADRKWYTLTRTDSSHDQVVAYGNFTLRDR